MKQVFRTLFYLIVTIVVSLNVSPGVHAITSTTGNTIGNIHNGGFYAQQGEWIFYSNWQNRGNLYKAKSDGSGRMKLSDDKARFINVIGNWVYYSDRNDNFKLYKITTDGKYRTKLNNDETYFLTVVGDWIYYQNVSDGYKIYKIKTDGTKRTKINDENSFFINVVGEWIFFSNDINLYKINVDGTRRTKVSDECCSYVNVAGDWVYYCSCSNGTLWKMKTNGSAKQKISNDCSVYVNVAGNWIYYINRTESSDPNLGKPYRIMVDGTNRQKLSDDYADVVNVIGNYVYYLNNTDNKMYRMNLDGTGRLDVDEYELQQSMKLVPTSQKYGEQLVKRALASNALLLKINDFSFDIIGGRPRTDYNIDFAGEMLDEWWGVNNREDTFETIEWLLLWGHSAKYEELAAIISLLTEDEFRELINDDLAEESIVRRLLFVKDRYQELQGKSLKGWDYCRAINVANEAYVAGYLSYEEAVDVTMYAARQLQKWFTSWEELGKNYILGTEFWGGDEESIDKRKEVLKWLLTDASSPWVKYSWHLSLDCADRITLPFLSSTPVHPKVVVNGTELQLDVPPVIEQGRMLVPMRAVFQALGARVEWDGIMRKVTASTDLITLVLTVGETNAFRNGASCTLDVPPKIINGRTMIPLRFVSEAMGMSVFWDANSQTVYITASPESSVSI
jgi:uncharacterized protein YchJ